METIGKTNMIRLFIAGLLFLSIGAFAQDNAKIITAFEESYTLENQGEYQSAINKLKNIFDEDSYEINLRLGWLSYQAGFFTESSAFYQRALSLKPMSIEGYFGIVYPEAAVGNWEKVMSYYRKILEIDPQNTLANYRMGAIYYGRADYQTSAKYLEKVINLYPFDYDSVVLYAWTNFRLGKLREAKVLFNKALMIKPNDKSALEGLGLIK